MGGELQVRDVLELIEDRIKDRFTEADLEILERNSFRRWESEARFARENLKKQRLLESGGRGIWRLTEQGHREATEISEQGSDED